MVSVSVADLSLCAWAAAASSALRGVSALLGDLLLPADGRVLPGPGPLPAGLLSHDEQATRTIRADTHRTAARGLLLAIAQYGCCGRKSQHRTLRRLGECSSWPDAGPMRPASSPRSAPGRSMT